MIPSRISFAVLLFVLVGCNTEAQKRDRSPERVGGPCEGCDAIYEGIPKNLSWQTFIADSTEPGERLEISGTIFNRDGKTRAKNIILYLYHTNTKGYYAPAKDQTGRSRHHGKLRGWVKTDELGRYRFQSIRPAPYPNGKAPAHIHGIVKEPDKSEYWIDDYFFEDDANLALEKKRQHWRGGFGIIKLTKNKTGVWTGTRDIVLGQNIPNYK